MLCDIWILRSFFLSSRRRHTICYRDWSSDVCSSDLPRAILQWVVHRNVAPGAHVVAVVWELQLGVPVEGGGLRHGRVTDRQLEDGRGVRGDAAALGEAKVRGGVAANAEPQRLIPQGTVGGGLVTDLQGPTRGWPDEVGGLVGAEDPPAVLGLVQPDGDRTLWRGELRPDLALRGYLEALSRVLGRGDQAAVELEERVDVGAGLHLAGRVPHVDEQLGLPPTNFLLQGAHDDDDEVRLAKQRAIRNRVEVRPHGFVKAD